jgi:hypothetical protein
MTKRKFNPDTAVPPWAARVPKPVQFKLASEDHKKLIGASLQRWGFMSSELAVELDWVQPIPGIDVFEVLVGSGKKIRVRIHQPTVTFDDSSSRPDGGPILDLAPAQQPA